MSKSKPSEEEPDIEELAEEVAQHREWLKKIMPSRRQVLTAGVVGAAGAAGFGAGSAQASGLNDGDTQWGENNNRDDYVVDHLDANSVTTVDTDTDTLERNSDISDATSIALPDILDANNDYGYTIPVQRTSSVGTSATVIWDITAGGSNGERAGALIIVFGKDGGGNRFTDTIHILINVGNFTVNHSETQGSPSGRTYSHSSGVVSLAMASGTMDVTAVGIAAVGEA